MLKFVKIVKERSALCFFAGDNKERNEKEQRKESIEKIDI